MNDEIVQSTAKTIYNYNLDTAIDIAEIGLDSFFDDSLFKDLSITRTIYGLVKTGLAIREKYFLKKTLMFINQLNNNGISNENYQQYKEKLKDNDKYILKELEYALIIIDRYVDYKKNIILANLYFNYIDKKFNWEQFQELSIIVDNIFLSDLKELENIYNRQMLTMNDINNKISFRRLKTQNLVENIENTLRSPDGMGIGFYLNDYDYQITELGRLLFEYGLNNNLNI